MNVAVIDFETTGVDHKICRPIEVSVTITNNNFSEELTKYSALMLDDSYPAITEEIEKLTGISQNILVSLGKNPASVFAVVVSLLKQFNVGHILAYNCEFDKNVCHEEIKRHPLFAESLSPLVNAKWLCAMRDVKKNYQYRCWKLSHLALDCGVTIDPTKLHRAAADVDLTIKMLKAQDTNVSEILTYNQTPWIPLEAVTREPWKDGGVSTKKAKDKGFRWETPQGFETKYLKRWVTMKKETECREFIDSCPELTIRRIV